MLETREESRSDRKHKAILEAATAVFLSKGYDGTSMDEIAASAGVSKQTVYKHFTDKEQLYAEIVRATTDQIDGLMRLVAETLAVTGDLDKGLSQLARRFLTALMEPRLLRLRRLVIANADRFPDVGRTWYEQGFGRVLATLATCFRRLAEHQLLHLDDPLLAANHFVGMLLWIPVNQAMFTGSVRRRSKAELEQYADAAVRAFLRAYSVKSEVAKSSVRSGRPSPLR
jgi:TetR/AcrR family transcriptional repressor of mexJK operon